MKLKEKKLFGLIKKILNWYELLWLYNDFIKLFKNNNNWIINLNKKGEFINIMFTWQDIQTSYIMTENGNYPKFQIWLYNFDDNILTNTQRLENLIVNYQ